MSADGNKPDAERVGLVLVDASRLRAKRATIPLVLDVKAKNAPANGLASSKTPTRMCREQFTGAAWGTAAGWAAEADAARAARAASAFVARLIRHVC